VNSFFDQLEAQLRSAAQSRTAGPEARLRTRWGGLRTGARIAPIVAALAVTLGVFVAALGTGSHAHRVGRQSQGVAGSGPARTTTGATSTTTRHTATTPSSLADCNAAGINLQQLREGTCLENAETVVVVNKTSTDHLKSLDASYRGLHSHGKFAIATITIKNKLDQPQRWQHTQAALFIPGGSDVGTHPFYVEDVHAEIADQNSCLWKTGTAAHGGLQPGDSMTCDVVIQIPASADPAGNGSGLYIANFGDEVSNPLQPVGIIRTYH
jgi:hypothetical protein